MNENLETRETPEIKEVDLTISQFNRDVSQQLEILLKDGDNQQEDITLDPKELEALAAMRSLPKDPLERMLLLEEFKKKPNGRFGDSALTALEAIGIHGKDVRIKLKKDWRDCLTYPQHVAKWAIEKLDEIALLVDMPETEYKPSRISEFLEIARDNGLLKDTDYSRIRTIIAQEM